MLESSRKTEKKAQTKQWRKDGEPWLEPETQTVHVNGRLCCLESRNCRGDTKKKETFPKAVVKSFWVTQKASPPDVTSFWNQSGSPRLV